MKRNKMGVNFQKLSKEEINLFRFAENPVWNELKLVNEMLKQPYEIMKRSSMLNGKENPEKWIGELILKRDELIDKLKTTAKSDRISEQRKRSEFKFFSEHLMQTKNSREEYLLSLLLKERKDQKQAPGSITGQAPVTGYRTSEKESSDLKNNISYCDISWDPHPEWGEYLNSMFLFNANLSTYESIFAAIDIKFSFPIPEWDADINWEVRIGGNLSMDILSDSGVATGYVDYDFWEIPDLDNLPGEYRELIGWGNIATICGEGNAGRDIYLSGSFPVDRGKSSAIYFLFFNTIYCFSQTSIDANGFFLADSYPSQGEGIKYTMVPR